VLGTDVQSYCSSITLLIKADIVDAAAPSRSRSWSCASSSVSRSSSRHRCSTFSTGSSSRSRHTVLRSARLVSPVVISVHCITSVKSSYQHLHRYETVDWVTGRASGLLKFCFSNPQRFSCGGLWGPACPGVISREKN